MQPEYQIIESISKAVDLVGQEQLLNRLLLESELTLDQLSKLESSPEIMRYPALVYIVQKYSDATKFKQAQKASESESIFKKILMAIGLGS